MERYKNLSGSSAISAYETGEDYIRVQFKDGSVYLYTYDSAGADDIEEMKILAESGQGLNAYINMNVKKDYEKKER